jgi:hypothetical protein
MIASTMDIENETKVNFEPTQSKLENGSGGSGGSGEGVNMNQSALIVSGRGTPRDYSLNQGTSHTITIDGEFYQTPDGTDGKPINKSMTI